MRSNKSIFAFRRLRWRLALSYAAVTIGTVAALHLFSMVVAGSLFFLTDLFAMTVSEKSKTIVPQFVPALQSVPANTLALEIRLEQLRDELEKRAPAATRGFGFGLNTSSSQTVFLAIAAPDGTPLAATPRPEQGPIRLPERALPFVEKVKKGERGSENLGEMHEDGTLVSITPILADAQPDAPLIGVFVVYIEAPFEWGAFTSRWLLDVVPFWITVTVITGVVGTLFGFLIARRFTRRLAGISSAAEGWSRGDFSLAAPEKPNDELGDLGRRLNAVSRDLQSLIQVRQSLATLQERQRLARDLHDTVKQHAFSCAMLLGATKRLMENDPAAALRRLTDAEQLVRRMQTELAEIIGELSENKTAAAGTDGLRQVVLDWSHHHGIAVEAEIPTVPLNASSAQALTRIVQEALANAVRHSAATQLRILLSRCKTSDGAERAELRISDNGRGFDAESPSKGLGLRSMRERAENLPDGTFELRSRPGKGTFITVTFTLSSP